MTEPPHNQETHLGVTRRDVLKLSALFGVAILLAPAERLTQFLFPPQQTGPVTYPRTKIANTADLAVGQSLLFEYPNPDRAAVLIHLSDGFVAFDATCTHLGCQIHFDHVPVPGWESNPENIFCPCHGAVFDPETGKVLEGPPPRPLPRIKLDVDGQGNIFANGYESGLPLYGED